MNRDPIDFLLARMAWPSCSVRERAATCIGELLTAPTAAEPVFGALRDWIARQPLETLAAYGLLPLVKAASLGAKFDAAAFASIAASFRRRSILGWLLMRELSEETAGPLDGWLAHSGAPPKDFQARAEFASETRYYVQHAYADWAESVEAKRRIPFCKQWEWEFRALHNGPGRRSDEGLNYWRTRDRRLRVNTAADPPSTETCRSAFLRALAWAVAEAGLPLEAAVERAALSCPLDLELWRLRPRQRPVWWPLIRGQGSSVLAPDTELWPTVEALWNKQEAAEALVAGESIGTDWVVVSASGFVGQAGANYHLEIHGGLQQSLGGNAPTEEEVIAAFSGENQEMGLYAAKSNSLLRLQGSVPRIPSSICGVQMRDWRLLPLACTLRPQVAHRWQIWRWQRLPHTLANWFSEKPTRVEVVGESLATMLENRELARWCDWTDGVGEQHRWGEPPYSGQLLVASRRWLEALCQHYGGRFVWACRLKAYVFEDRAEELKEVVSHRVFGASGVVMP